MSSYILIDSVIFFISNIILGIYVFRNKKINIKEKIAYTIFFIILNSSFNIMMKKVHEYNLAIPRTYIYRQKLIGPLSGLDIICMIYIILNFKYMINVIIKNKIVFLHVLRCVGVYLIGTIAFIIFEGYWMDNGNRFFMVSKGWIYSLATLILTFKYMNKNVNLIYPFAIILINGMISTFFIPSSEIWVRYSNRTIILDQEDAYTISNCIISLLMIKCLYIKDNKNKIVDYIMLTFFIFQNLYCMYKTNLIILPIIFLTYLLITKGKNKFMLLATYLGIPTMILFAWDKIYKIFTSMSINTRMVQITDYLDYIQEKGIFPYIIGSGISTPYYSNTDTGDTGERKATDIINNNYALEWRTDIQTPVISIYKESGLIGMIYFILITIYISIITIKMIKNVLKDKKNEDYLLVETVGIGIFMIVSTATSLFMYGGSIPYCIFYTFCLAKFAINCKKIKEKEESK